MFFKLTSLVSIATIISGVFAAPLDGSISERAVSYKGWLKVVRTDSGRKTVGWVSKTADGTGYQTTTDESQRLAVRFTVPDGGIPYAIQTLNSAYQSTPWLGWYPSNVDSNGSFGWAVLAGATAEAAPYTYPVEDYSGRGQTETTVWNYDPATSYVYPGYWINPDYSQVSGASMWWTEDNHIHLVGQGLKAHVAKRQYYETYPYPITFQWENCYDKC